MAVYLILFGGLFAIGKMGKPTKQFNSFYFILSLLSISLVVGCRGSSVGNDTQTYINIINSIISAENIFNLSTHVEIGFIILVKLLSFVSTSATFILFCISFLTNFFILKGIFKYSKDITLSILLFFVMGIFFSSLNVIRQVLAWGIIFYGYKFVIDRKLLKFIICVAFATSIHLTGIIAIVLYFVYAMKITRKRMVVLLALTVLFTIFSSYFLNFIFIIFSKYDGYQDSSYFDGSGVLGRALALILLVSTLFATWLFTRINIKKNGILLKGKNLDDKNEADKFLKLGVYCFIISILMCIVSLKMNILGRVIGYFDIALIVLVPNIAYKLKRQENKIIYPLLIIVVYGVYMAIWLIFRPEWNAVLPYVPFWI